MTKKVNYKFNNSKVRRLFDSLPNEVQPKLLFLRQLIFDTAKEINEVGDIEESLKWGEPSYSPIKPKVGSPIRINQIKKENKYAIYFNCQSNLVPTFKQIYPKTFNYGGNRSIIFDINDKIPVTQLRHCISLALTYHLNKKLLIK
jgi:hypothetical protein